MAGRDKPPSPMAVLARNGLAPATSWDAETLAQFPPGTEFDLVCRTRRSGPHHRTYWRALAKAVEATGRWKTAKVLHVALKIETGRIEPVINMRGQIVGMQPDSIAFDEMTQAEFRAYFDDAMAALSEALGYDALAWMEAA